MGITWRSRDVLFGAAALVAAAGTVIIVFVLTWVKVPRALGLCTEVPVPPFTFRLGGWLTLAGAVGAALTLIMSREESDPGPERSRVSFGRALVGLGYVFCLDGILNLIAFAGFAWTGVLNQIFPIMADGTKTSDDAGTIAAIRLIVALGMAVLGALFFITNSIRAKRERGEVYDHYKFWSGNWFRLGEAMLFTVVFFLALRSKVRDGDRILPLLALFLGMFVTTGETLVFGIAQRVLRAAAALVGTDEPTTRRPRVTAVSKVTAPPTGPGAALTTVTINGDAFSRVAGTVMLDEYALQPATWADTRVTFVLPAQHPDGTSWPVVPASRSIQIGVAAGGQRSNTMPLTIP